MKRTIVSIQNADEWDKSCSYPGAYYCGDLNSSQSLFKVLKKYNCREEFMMYYLEGKIGEKHVFFGHSVGENPAFSLSEYRLFLRLIERTLKIRKTFVVLPTDIQGMVMIGVNSWWIKNTVRREFLTILLRCYCHWKSKTSKKLDKNTDIYEVLSSYEYFGFTTLAVKSFLSGRNTIMEGYVFKHWFETFKLAPKEFVDKILVKMDFIEDDANRVIQKTTADLLGKTAVVW